MKDKSGHLKKRCLDRKTEAGAACSRVKAVYGRIDEIAELERMQDVTQHLGTVKHISAGTAADFRKNIEKFIDSRTDNLREMKGGEFWPIVKCVKIQVAQAEVLKTGVVLVDLPGIRDSNAARDSVAKEYLKNCNAVWVVASITRAVDDKTAKEILNGHLRRQLFMDGQFGNLAFVCTKTDSFNISDIVRDLDLREEIQPLEEELEELEHQRAQVAEEKNHLHLALQPERRQQGVATTGPAWLQRHYEFLEKEFQVSVLQKQKEAKLRAISLVCVQARNTFSKHRIRMDFSTGLEEFRRKAELSECDLDGDTDMEDGDFAGSDPGDVREAESQREKLHVFTVSSTEYLKLSGKLLRDGEAQVFHDPQDTEIPALKNFAIETALKTSMKATEKLIRDVARVISQIVHYLTNQRAEDVHHQAQAQEILHQALLDLPRFLQEAADSTFPDVQYCFGVRIQASLLKGASKAKESCQDVVRSWGSREYGIPHGTYHAVCLRRGFYTSPHYGSVDFNQHLAKPIQDAIFVAWNEVFSSKLEESFQRFTKTVSDQLKWFFVELKRKLGGQSSLTEALDALLLQQMEAVQAREHIQRRFQSLVLELTKSLRMQFEPLLKPVQKNAEVIPDLMSICAKVDKICKLPRRV
ncbi:uncharacterized protein LOC125425079 isoform X2 [Sphaerodactylus townsendi]|uniref:uncharacterized protein LOC125425079 isoform X2 n=1 Tax=Sphaerodactylus townsendi TaxID=933632 RepID=UPI002026778D|nr:uncharacterized protein LOC125425079 isoform X2 [Sphaerodactylus townsendi]